MKRGQAVTNCCLPSSEPLFKNEKSEGSLNIPYFFLVSTKKRDTKHAETVACAGVVSTLLHSAFPPGRLRLQAKAADLLCWPAGSNLYAMTTMFEPQMYKLLCSCCTPIRLILVCHFGQRWVRMPRMRCLHRSSGWPVWACLTELAATVQVTWAEGNVAI